MADVDFPFESIDSFAFAPKPQPLPAILRPVYRIALILLVLKINCRGNTASLLKLQFFNWLLKDMSLQEIFISRMTKESKYALDIIHLDPMVNLALKYAFADRLISVTANSKYKLEKKGLNFVEQLIKNKQLTLTDEQNLLSHIGQNVSEVKLRKDMP